MSWLRNQLMSITSAICDTILNCQPNPLFANSLGDSVTSELANNVSGLGLLNFGF